MAFTAASWSWGYELVGEAPLSALGAIDLFINEDSVDSSFFSDVDNGGGDIRASLDSAGSAQLPIHVLYCDTSTNKLLLRVRLPSYTSGARSFWLFAGNTGQTQPAADSTFGSEAVYQDYEQFLPLNEDPSTATNNYADVTGNNPGGTAESEYATSGDATPWGDVSVPQTRTAGESILAAYTAAPGLVATSSIWAKCADLANDYFVFSDTDGDWTSAVWMDAGGSGDGWRSFHSAVSEGAGVGAVGLESDNNASTDWQRITLAENLDTGESSLYVDGVLAGTGTNLAAYTTLSQDEFYLGLDTRFSSRYFSGSLALRSRKYEYVAADHEALLYSNESDPGTFWTLNAGSAATLVPDNGVMSFAGTAVGLLHQKRIALDAGQASVTGQDVGLRAARTLTVDPGAISYVGTDVTLAYQSLGYSITLDAGSVGMSGQDVGLFASRAVTVETGAATFTGTSIDLVYETPAYTIVAEPGAVGVTGQGLGLLASRVLAPENGVMSLAGQDLGLLASRILAPESGVIDVTGQDVGLLASRALTVGPGNIDLTGAPISLSYSGQVILRVGSVAVEFAPDFVTLTYET